MLTDYTTSAAKKPMSFFPTKEMASKAPFTIY